MIPVSLLCVLICVFPLIGGQAIHFGDPEESGGCSTFDGREGSCKVISECPNREMYPPICGRRGNEDVVCCPHLDISVKTGSAVAAPDTSFECGTRTSSLFRRKKRSSQSLDSTATAADPTKLVAAPLKSPTTLDDQPFSFDLHQPISAKPPIHIDQPIVGGEISEENTWPWMALLGSGQGETGRTNWFCDGVLVNENWVLTAAHCLIVDFTNVIVRLGEHDYSDPNNLHRTDLNAIHRAVHPLYSPEQGYYDLGLVRLDKRVTITSKIRPVCLPWGEKSTKDVIGNTVTLTGWGTEEFGGRPSSVLREAEVTIFNPSVCEESYSTLLSFARDFPEGMTKENIICAGNPDGGVDACQGDSGGPIVQREISLETRTSIYTLVGLVSKGHGCGLEEFPGLYAPVAKYLAWIKEVAFPAA